MIYGLVVQGFECKLVESCAILGFTFFFVFAVSMGGGHGSRLPRPILQHHCNTLIPHPEP